VKHTDFRKGSLDFYGGRGCQKKKKKKFTIIKKNENNYMADGCQKKKKSKNIFSFLIK